MVFLRTHYGALRISAIRKRPFPVIVVAHGREESLPRRRVLDRDDSTPNKIAFAISFYAQQDWRPVFSLSRVGPLIPQRDKRNEE